MRLPERRVGMGPIKSRTKIKDIESIRSVAVRPWRDFLGRGFRVKTDGARGFIAGRGPGVEFTKSNGKRVTVSVRDPQAFVDFVRQVKMF